MFFNKKDDKSTQLTQYQNKTALLAFCTWFNILGYQIPINLHLPYIYMRATD